MEELNVACRVEDAEILCKPRILQWRCVTLAGLEMLMSNIYGCEKVSVLPKIVIHV